MSEVFSCALDSNIKVYNQGADSTHVNYGDVDKDVEEYDTYNQDVVGESFGGFMCIFFEWSRKRNLFY